jgi:predicted GIY-YIG superfamily endonuclease
LAHAQHYIGWTGGKTLEKRIERHRVGGGSKLMQAIKVAKINWQVVRTWEGVDRSFERKLKNQNHAARYCPICCDTKQPRDVKVEQFIPTESEPF